MEHRHLFGHSQLNPDNEQIRNKHPPDPQLNLGTDSFMIPTDFAIHAYPNTSLETNVLPLRNHMPEVPSIMIDNNAGTSYDPYMYPTIGTCSQLLSHYIQHSPCYEYVGVWDVSASHNHQVECHRAAYKRKAPAISDAEREDASAFHSIGSSSSHMSSVKHWQADDISGPQYWHSELLNAVPSSGRKSTPPDEGFQRNVRSRHGNSLHMGVSAANHSPSNLCFDFQSGEYTYGHVATGQWNPTPSLISRTTCTSSEINNFAYDADCSHCGNIDHDDRVESAEGFGFHHRNLTPFTMSSDGLTQGTVVGRGSYNQRMTQWTHTDNPSLGLAGNLEDTRPQGNENIVPPRYSRPLSTMGRGYERNVRVRNRHGRFSFSDESARARWVSEGIAMTDRSAYYESANLFDQHQDMRLDIDNMTYEELLALEDRIGYVNTGLSEDAMSRCLIETIYCPTDHILEGFEEDDCAICLESYEDGELVGRLKCRHDFHASCIKKWLLIKKTCPICKESPLEENPKGQ